MSPPPTLYDAAGVSARLLKGDVLAGARAIRWLDDRDPRGAQVIAAIYAHTGRAHLVGVTGPAGSGKSTLVDALVTELRAQGKRVGVIAVEPSSQQSGGAVLGDRLRMARHATDPDVFIRSLGTRGQIGGISRSTNEACLVLDAMGYDTIIVETVGVGQDEIDVVSLAHTTVIVSIPSDGDGMQAFKSGLMEVGDIFVMNKADQAVSENAASQIAKMLELRGDSVPLLRTVATTGQGVTDLARVIADHRTALDKAGEFTRRSNRRTRTQVLALVRDTLGERAMAMAMAGPQVFDWVERRQIDPHSAAAAIVSALSGMFERTHA